MAFAIACLFSPLATFLIHALVSRSFFRRWPPRSPQKSLVFIILCSCFSYGLAASYFAVESGPAQVLITMAYVFLTSLGFGYAYFHFFNMSETARRIHILTLVFESTILGKAEAKIELAGYDARKMIEVRIRRMTNMGAIYLQNGKLFAKGGGLHASGILFKRLRDLFYGSQKTPIAELNG